MKTHVILNRLFCLLLVLYIFSSCKKDDPSETIDPDSNLPKFEATITGPSEGTINVLYDFSFQPQQANENYYIDWGDGTSTTWFWQVSPGYSYMPPLNHKWNKSGTYGIHIKKDGYSWSDPFYITIKNTTTFYHCFSELMNGTVNGIYQLPDSSYLVFGNYTSNNVTMIFLSKLGSKGDVVWTKSYQRGNFKNYVITPSNEIIIIGYYFDYILKLNFNGDELYNASIQPPNGVSMTISDFIATSVGNYFVSGYCHSSYSNYGAIIKIDPMGNTLWVSSINGKQIDRIFEENNGEIIALLSSSDFSMAKFDANGNNIWTQIIATNNHKCKAIFKTMDNHYLICAVASQPQMVFIKTDLDGNVISYTPVENASFSGIYSCITTSDNRYVWIGYSLYDYGSVGTAIKTDDQGNVIWSRDFNESNNFIKVIGNVSETLDKGFALGGNKNYDQYGNIVPIIAKTDSYGRMP